jgi:hypothetical protein
VPKLFFESTVFIETVPEATLVTELFAARFNWLLAVDPPTVNPLPDAVTVDDAPPVCFICELEP